MIRLGKIILIVGILLMITTSAMPINQGTWGYVGSPYAIGLIEEISIGHRAGTRYIFLADSSAHGTLWRSSNDGLNWTKSHEIEGYSHSRVVIQETDFLFGWTLIQQPFSVFDPNAGPYRTTNQGETWDLRASGLPHREFYALAADQNSVDLRTAYIGGMMNSANNYQGLYRTTDGGEAWELSQNGFPPGLLGVIKDISICRTDPDYVFCTCWGIPDNQGIYRSTDAGNTWERISLPNGERPDRIAIDPNMPSHVVVSYRPSPYGLYETFNALDDQPDWILLATFYYEPIECLRIDNSNCAYMAIENRDYFIVRIQGGEFTYLPTGNGFVGDRLGESVAIDPLDDNIICAATYSMLYYSSDHGANFQERVNGTNKALPTFIDIDQTTLCAISSTGGIYKSTDTGVSWIFRSGNSVVGSALEREWDHTNAWFASSSLSVYPG